MKGTLREYGLIIGLIVISISGYLLFSQNKEDILAYSLDVLGTKLVSLIDDDAAKMRVASAFERFEQQVLNDEISSDQVQFVAANVLNLSNSNARLTPEEAELVLTVQSDSPERTLPSPEVSSTPPRPKTRRASSSHRAEVGENIHSMIQFADEVAVLDTAAFRLVRFESGDQGLHVIVDPNLENHFRTGDFSAIRDHLAEKKLVRWAGDLEKDANKKARWFERQERRLAAAESSFVQTGEQSKRLQTLGRISRLQSLGATLAIDSTLISQEIEVILAETMAEVEAILAGRGASVSVRSDSLVRKRQ